MRLIQKNLIVLLLILSSCFVFGAKDSIDIALKKGDQFFQQENYHGAQIHYHYIDESFLPKVPEAMFKLGVCYVNTGYNYKKAIEYLLASEEYTYDLGVEEEYHYFLGRAYHLNYQFLEAINSFHQFGDLVSPRDERMELVNYWIRQCQNAPLIMKKSVDVDIVNMGDLINSKEADYTPLVSADESVLLFTSRREGSTGGLQNLNGRPDSVSGRHFEDIYASIKLNGNWIKPVSVGVAINTEGHDAVAGISPDGQVLYMYRSDSSLYGNIFKSIQSDYEWGRLQKLPSPINSKFWEGSITVTNDGNTFYFASNRPGGYGGKDIYMVNKLPNGQWAQPKNLGKEVNSEYDEDAPFFHEESNTLYFSSQGHFSMGGFDIFKSELQEGFKWTKAKNVGYPINTTQDDISFVLNGDGKRGYYAANRADTKGDKDIYVINFKESDFAGADQGPVTILKGLIKTCDNQSTTALIKLFNYETKEFVGVYQSNPTTGNFVIAIPTGKRYQMQIEAPGYTVSNRVISKGYGEGQIEINETINLCNNNTEEIDRKTIIVASPDSVVLYDSTRLVIDILSNDIYPSNYELFSQITKPGRGRVTFDNTGQLRYFTVPFFKGIDSFSYEILLNHDIKSEAKVYVDYRDLLENQALKHTIKDSATFALSIQIKEKFDTVAISGIRYKIQLGAFKQKLDKKSALLKTVPKAKYEKSDDGLHKYLLGNYRKMEEVIDNLIRVRRNGIKDAFMVVYKDNERISIQMLYDIAFPEKKE